MQRALRLGIILLSGSALTACASVGVRYATKPATKPAAAGAYKVGKPYQVAGVWYTPREQPDYDEVGVGSWYGEAFHMKPTANGERFDMNAVSAAHTTLPLPSLVEVTNLENGRRLTVRVNDRGPFANNRIIDLSREAARQLGYDRQGIAKVRVRYLGPAGMTRPGGPVQYADARIDDRLLMEIAAGSPPPAPPAPVVVAQPSAAPPLAPAPVTVAELAPAAPAAPPVIAGPSGELRIQAGAFASEANAERAVAQLASAGQAAIETVERDGVRLFRVVLPAPPDEAEAYALRDRIAEIGFPDALVARAF